MRGANVRVHILITGPIGGTWRDVDEHVRVPAGTTLEGLLAAADTSNIPLRAALEHPLHVTMTLNGERCVFDENKPRVLVDGDEISLLAPAPNR